MNKEREREGGSAHFVLSSLAEGATSKTARLASASSRRFSDSSACFSNSSKLTSTFCAPILPLFFCPPVPPPGFREASVCFPTRFESEDEASYSLESTEGPSAANTKCLHLRCIVQRARSDHDRRHPYCLTRPSCFHSSAFHLIRTAIFCLVVSPVRRGSRVLGMRFKKVHVLLLVFRRSFFGMFFVGMSIQMELQRSKYDMGFAGATTL